MSKTQLRILQLQGFIIRNRNRRLVAEKAGLHWHTVSRFVNGNVGIANFLKIESAVEEILANPFFIDKKNSPRRG